MYETTESRQSAFRNARKVLIVTREYPPHIYGGAGVHVEHLVRELARLIEVEVRCFGDQSIGRKPGGPEVRGFPTVPVAFEGLDPRLRKALEPLGVNLAMVAAPADCDLVHCHTWYSLMAGLWTKLLHGVPLVATIHSLEPLRPWKEEQLGGGYRLSTWIERAALEAADRVIAVSEGTRRELFECYDVDPARVRVVHNGVDTEVFRRRDPAPALERYGIDGLRPYALFVGRITRQKGVLHLVRALRRVETDLQAVLCAGAPDTPGILREMEEEVRELSGERGGVHWIREIVPPEDLARLYSGATVFVCPSIHEPFGIINLEAMACGCPVVASAVGGIPEAVADGETGILVPFEPVSARRPEPREPERFEGDLAAAIDRLASDPAMRKRMGEAGPARVEARFSWTKIARRTLEVYEEAAGEGKRET